MPSKVLSNEVIIHLGMFGSFMKTGFGVVQIALVLTTTNSERRCRSQMILLVANDMERYLT